MLDMECQRRAAKAPVWTCLTRQNGLDITPGCESVRTVAPDARLERGASVSLHPPRGRGCSRTMRLPARLRGCRRGGACGRVTRMRPEWEPEELVACWTLVDADWELVANKAGATRLGFALLLKFFELEAHFPRDRGGAAAGRRRLRRRAGRRRAGRARRVRLGGPFNQVPAGARARGARLPGVDGGRRAALGALAAGRGLPGRVERVRDALLRRCRGDRIEPPGSSRIDRMLGAARAGRNAECTARTVARLSDGAIERLERLVSEAAGSAVGGGAGLLAELKADRGRVGLKTLLAVIEDARRVAWTTLLRRPGVTLDDPAPPPRRHPGRARPGVADHRRRPRGVAVGLDRARATRGRLPARRCRRRRRREHAGAAEPSWVSRRIHDRERSAVRGGVQRWTIGNGCLARGEAR